MKLKYEFKLRFKDEQAFPLFFKMNYYEEIRPRLDILKLLKKTFNFSEAMRGTDEEFCEKFEITKE